jgi:hypothetical protein
MTMVKSLDKILRVICEKKKDKNNQSEDKINV